MELAHILIQVCAGKISSRWLSVFPISNEGLLIIYVHNISQTHHGFPGISSPATIWLGPTALSL